MIPPVPFGFDGDLTLIPTPAGSAFDTVEPAHALAREIVGNLLHPERAARLVSFSTRDPANPSLGEVLDALVNATWGAGPATGSSLDAALRRVAQRAALDGLLDLAGDSRATAEVRATVEHRLARLQERLVAAPAGATAADLAHRATARRDIARFFDGEDDATRRPRPAVIPLPWP